MSQEQTGGSEYRYPFAEVETRWRRIWDREKHYEADLDDPARKLYVLTMFSYPSGDRMHIGHWYNYGPVDTWARFRKMQGYDVLEPQGFDSFGLPAENYAIKHGVHPKKSIRANIEKMIGQLKNMGAMFDWRQVLETSDPEYYKWTQWLFLELHRAGLAYQADGQVNWCNSCQTVLANEQVTDGECERCGSPVVRKEMNQWYFRITKYAQELLDGLNTLDWPEKTRKSQTNWIGRSDGAQIRFRLETTGEDVEVFTTRPDTLYGVTYIVFAPEHPQIPQITTPGQRAEVDGYIHAASHLSEIDRTSTVREKTGVFSGTYAIHPLTGERVPVWIGDYVLASYGTGIVMAVPAHDQRDFEFARKYNLPVRVVIQPQGKLLDSPTMKEAFTEAGTMVNSAEFNGMDSVTGQKKITELLEQRQRGSASINYRLRDWLISRQRYWGAPIPIIHCDECGAVPVPDKDLPVLLPDDVDFNPKGKSPLASSETYMNAPCPRCGKPARRDPDTMDTFVCSSWYFLRYPSSHLKDKPFDPERTRKWLPVDMYVGGMEHANGHLLFSRFVTRALHDRGWLDFQEPFQRLIHQGTITRGGEKMSKSKGNAVSPDEFVEKHGADVFRMYMMFMGDFREGGDWDENGINGIDRFVNRIWRLVNEHWSAGVLPSEQDIDKDLNRVLHYTIQQVTRDLESFHFNTAISRLMELVNELYRRAGESPDATRFNHALEVLIRLLAPFAPHLAEELWRRTGQEESVFRQEWPAYNEAALLQDTNTLVIQINGKVRDQIEAAVDIDDDSLKQIVLAREKVVGYLEGKQLLKFVHVKGRLVSLVIK